MVRWEEHALGSQTDQLWPLVIWSPALSLLGTCVQSHICVSISLCILSSNTDCTPRGARFCAKCQGPSARSLCVPVVPSAESSGIARWGGAWESLGTSAVAGRGMPFCPGREKLPSRGLDGHVGHFLISSNLSACLLLLQTPGF